MLKGERGRFGRGWRGSTAALTVVSLLVVGPTGWAHEETGSPVFEEYGRYTVFFTDPDFRLRPDGAALEWHREAVAPTCDSENWGGDGYVYMQVRHLDSDAREGQWLDFNPFGPSSSSCTLGRYFGEMTYALSGDRRLYPYWELRYVRQSELSGGNPTVYMLARTTRSGYECNPFGLRIKDVWATSLAVTWEDCQIGTDLYVIERSSDGGTSWVEAGTTPGAIQRFVDQGLEPGLTYHYRVASVAGNGTRSEYSTPATGSTLAASRSAYFQTFGNFGAVTLGDPILQVSQNGQSLLWTNQAFAPTCSKLFWPDDGYIYMEVRKLTPAGEPADVWKGVNPWDPGNCNTGGRWSFNGSSGLSGENLGWPYWELRFVRLSDLPSENPKTYMLARTTEAGVEPLAPSNLRATAIQQPRRVFLDWDDNSQTETAFELQRSTDAGASWQSLGTLPANITSATDVDVRGKRKLFYRVRALDAANRMSSWSNTVEVTIGFDYVAFGDSLTTGFSIPTCDDQPTQSEWGCIGTPTVTPYPERVRDGNLTVGQIKRVGIWGYWLSQAIDDYENDANAVGGWDPQLLAVENANTLVTGALGINDMEFSDVPHWALECNAGLGCGWHVAEHLHAMQEDLDTLFYVLSVAKERGAKVVVPLYYNPISNKTLCQSSHSIADEIVRGLNAELQRRAEALDIFVADIYSAFQGHGAGDPEPYVFGTECNDVAALFQGIIGNEDDVIDDYDPHPNAPGAQVIANVILGEV